MFTLFFEFMSRGGLVMWPLLAISLVAVALSFERTWYWLRTNSFSRLRMLTHVKRHLRRGDFDEARKLIGDDRSVYGRVARQLIEEGATEPVMIDAIESQRPAIERFMPTLSTIITAAPMLGILGTVLGIIASFNVLSQDAVVADPASVSGGIAEALLTTAFGLLIAIATLLPYNACRAQIDRTMGRLETIAAAASRVKTS